jgi:hypothetical protein
VNGGERHAHGGERLNGSGHNGMAVDSWATPQVAPDAEPDPLSPDWPGAAAFAGIPTAPPPDGMAPTAPTNGVTPAVFAGDMAPAALPDGSGGYGSNGHQEPDLSSSMALGAAQVVSPELGYGDVAQAVPNPAPTTVPSQRGVSRTHTFSNAPASGASASNTSASLAPAGVSASGVPASVASASGVSAPEGVSASGVPASRVPASGVRAPGASASGAVPAVDAATAPGVVPAPGAAPGSGVVPASGFASPAGEPRGAAPAVEPYGAAVPAGEAHQAVEPQGATTPVEPHAVAPVGGVADDFPGAANAVPGPATAAVPGPAATSPAITPPAGVAAPPTTVSIRSGRVTRSARREAEGIRAVPALDGSAARPYAPAEAKPGRQRSLAPLPPGHVPFGEPDSPGSVAGSPTAATAPVTRPRLVPVPDPESEAEAAPRPGTRARGRERYATGLADAPAQAFRAGRSVRERGDSEPSIAALTGPRDAGHRDAGHRDAGPREAVPREAPESPREAAAFSRYPDDRQVLAGEAAASSDRPAADPVTERAVVPGRHEVVEPAGGPAAPKPAVPKPAASEPAAREPAAPGLADGQWSAECDGDESRAEILPQRVPAKPDVPALPDSIAEEMGSPTESDELARIAAVLKHDAPPPPTAESFDVEAVLAAVREVPGVSDAQLRRNREGSRVHTLRLDLADGADPGQVSRVVARLLGERMGLSAGQGTPFGGGAAAARTPRERTGQANPPEPARAGSGRVGVGSAGAGRVGPAPVGVAAGPVGVAAGPAGEPIRSGATRAEPGRIEPAARAAAARVEQAARMESGARVEAERFEPDRSDATRLDDRVEPGRVYRAAGQPSTSDTAYQARRRQAGAGVTRARQLVEPRQPEDDRAIKAPPPSNPGVPPLGNPGVPPLGNPGVPPLGNPGESPSKPSGAKAPHSTDTRHGTGTPHSTSVPAPNGTGTPSSSAGVAAPSKPGIPPLGSPGTPALYGSGQTPGSRPSAAHAANFAANLGASLGLTAVAERPSRPLPPRADAARIVLDHVQVSTFGLDATVEVRLALGSRRALGEASGPAVDGYVLRLGAAAAATAIDELLVDEATGTSRGRCFVEHAAVVPFGSCEVAIVVVLLVCHGWVEQLAGSALVAGDPRQSVVRATLAAVNRRLESLLP